ncbi:hypothetical protein FTO70_08640 [Methanosarcina sp. KYL-1]|uniref:type II toxin-antitoxin system RelE family toxin n=1 Tax=Methanosarcina sp. KYL-1 TaxID=2602068 RepID=UPI00210165AE|nr:type II toxin-antitoxin system RelE/ParE family toxin [Methanosarcina sp. KYL-1]MCQ1535743.1 hypothetical protein [Methanosarcina sp. KYL-1]
MVESGFEKKVLEELNFIKKQLWEVREHMVDVDTVLSWEEKELVNASFRNESEGKLRALKEFKEEMGLKRDSAPETFRIFLDVFVQSFLEKAGRYIDYRIADLLQKLSSDPVPPGASRILDSQEKLFRLRAGNYRLLYRIDFENHKVIILKVDCIGRVYC